MKRLPYRLMSLGLSAVSGMIAGGLSKGTWKLQKSCGDADWTLRMS